MTDQVSDNRPVQVREAAGEALTRSGDPVVELRFLIEGARRGDVAELAGDSWEVRSCSIEPEPDGLSRYR